MNKETKGLLWEAILGLLSGVFLLASILVLVHCLEEDATCTKGSEVISCSSR